MNKSIKKIYENYLWKFYLKFPSILHKKKIKMDIKKNLLSKSFIISFDCDTTDDIQSSLEVFNKLQKKKITPIFAVPSEIIKEGMQTFESIRNKGGIFINHGFKKHTFYNNKKKRHESCFFYDKLPEKTIENDIVKGHNFLKKFLKKHPNGFRTPHFGTFQNKKNLELLHKILKKKNYLYSSSTIPSYGYINGSIINDHGVYEFPVSGRYSSPLLILDSWGFFAAPNRNETERDYMMEIEKMINVVKNNCGIINIYADPSHVVKSKIFFKSMDLLNNSLENKTFEDFLNIG